MNTSKRNILLDLVCLVNKKDKFYIYEILEQIKIELEREKEDLQHKLTQVDNDLELLKITKEKIDNKLKED